MEGSMKDKDYQGLRGAGRIRRELERSWKAMTISSTTKTASSTTLIPSALTSTSTTSGSSPSQDPSTLSGTSVRHSNSVAPTLGQPLFETTMIASLQGSDSEKRSQWR
ncbi:hypothetical protein OS493_036131 [Desmophyllum pertusum]|uniref:Uncharacterized protein n=1 Tax=Desmophyllum pertusum TaxID=174260 RepID=A0A9W9Y7K2_9CNID|nr:hypothetical protein OS493_036131 [Desmophyllum pertusum]